MLNFWPFNIRAKRLERMRAEHEKYEEEMRRKREERRRWERELGKRMEFTHSHFSKRDQHSIPKMPERQCDSGFQAVASNFMFQSALSLATSSENPETTTSRSISIAPDSSDSIKSSPSFSSSIDSSDSGSFSCSSSSSDSSRSFGSDF